VIDFELEQLNKIIQEEYGFFDCEEGQYNPPKVTLIIVNKRVRQRFFQQTFSNGQTFIDNPPQGTYVD
jgi:hypothetical protein